MADKRELENPYEDFVPHRDLKILDLSNKTIHPEFLDKIKSASSILLERLDRELDTRDKRNACIYTGTCGIASLYHLIGTRTGNQTYIKKSELLAEESLKYLKRRGKDITFLTGDTGPLAFCAVLYNQHQNKKSLDLANRIMALVPGVVNDSDLPDEILFGRAGFLHALLYLNKHLGPTTVNSNTIREVITAILNSGIKLSGEEKHKVPLMYRWHGKYYIGGAHGIAGILYTLLQAKDYLSEIELEQFIRPTIDYLQGLRFPSHNFPSSLGNNSDRLVQWCHGAPGVVQLFGEAYRVFGDEQYLQTALQCGDVVWQRGILSKGYSICHGVAGNAYTFLYLYQLTQDVKHLHRACQFAHWCFSYGTHQGLHPDRPLSLFEGLAGAIYFLIDIQDPTAAKFPAFSL